MSPIWIQILIAGIHTFLVLLVILWKIPTKDDMNRLERKIDNLDQRLFDHISNHPKS